MPGSWVFALSAGGDGYKTGRMSSYRSLPRVIARLDIKGPNLVKGISFEGLRVLGKPELFSRLYYEEGADELLYVDAVASLYGRNSLLEVVERTAREIFIPLTVGGGLRSLDDIRDVLRAGADKVSINTAVVQRPELISEAAETFGSSTILVSVEAYRQPSGNYEAYVDYGRQSTGVDAVEWAIRAASLGAGELMVTCVNREGSGTGIEAELVRQIASKVSIPVIAAGGVGNLEHICEAFENYQADAVALASCLHYEALTRLSVTAASYEGEGNIEYLQKGVKGPSRVLPLRLGEVKRRLQEKGIPCRV